MYPIEANKYIAGTVKVRHLKLHDKYSSNIVKEKFKRTEYEGG